jgi:hypothetical protein
MPIKANFIAVAHIYLRSSDYVAAIAEADDIKIAVERDILDLDEGESIDIVETIEADEAPTPQEKIINLRKARNILLTMRSKESYEIARSLDEMTHALALRTDPEFARGSYDYGNMMRVTKEVMDGLNPLDH